MLRFLSLMAMLLVATGCQQSISSESTPAATPAVAEGEAPPTVEFEVPGISCEGCVAAVCNALADVPGVVEASGSAETKKITIVVDESEFDVTEAEEAIEATKGEATLTSDSSPAAK